jgi:hypothetical protein
MGAALQVFVFFSDFFKILFQIFFEVPINSFFKNYQKIADYLQKEHGLTASEVKMIGNSRFYYDAQVHMTQAS